MSFTYSKYTKTTSIFLQWINKCLLQLDNYKRTPVDKQN